MSVTKVPTIPPVGGGNTDYILTNLKMLLDVREGRSGNKLDANVTYRDLVNLGLAGDPTGEVVYIGGTSSLSGLPVLPSGIDNDGYDPKKDLTPPPSPEDVEATGSIGVIFLSWNQPTYRNHSYAEIWRSETDDVGTAVFVGTSSSQGYVDVPGDQNMRYYWVRFVSQANVKGAYSQQSTSAKADIDPAVIISKIEGQILESSLSKSLKTRINNIEDGFDNVGSIQNAVRTLRARTDTSTATISAAINTEQTERTTADTALASDITTLTSTVNTNNQTLTSALQTEATTRATADTALSSDITTLISTVDTNNQTLTAALQTEATTRATADTALSSDITTLISTVNTNNQTLTAALQTEATTRANADGSLFAQYTVKIDNNGHVSGFGLASETVSGTTTSAFIIRADKFAIVDPASTSNNLTNTPSADTVPFSIVGGVTYLKSAMIQDASISSAKIASLVANKITSGYINAIIGINGAKVYGAELYSGGSVTTQTDASGNVTGFTPANTTVKIAGGNATFNASSFKIANSATGTPTDYIPFEVVNNIVYIKTAMIRDASISLAKIDTANITNLSAISANMGTITAGKMQSTDGKFVIDMDNKYIKIEV